MAIYAACVSTGALLVQIRNWFASGARLRINVISDGLVIGGDPRFDERDLVIVNATNIGSADTMITNLSVEERDPFYYFWRRTPKKIYVITNPQLMGHPPNIPLLLAPAHRWTGIVRNRPDIVKNLRNGDYYISLQVSHRKRPYLKRIKPVIPAKSGNL